MPKTPSSSIHMSMIAPGVLGVKMIGRLDSMSTGNIWRETNLELDKTSPNRVIVDASEIEYCDGSCIGYLFGLRQRQKKIGGALSNACRSYVRISGSTRSSRSTANARRATADDATSRWKPSAPRPRRWSVPAVWNSADASARRSHRRVGAIAASSDLTPSASEPSVRARPPRVAGGAASCTPRSSRIRRSRSPRRPDGRGRSARSGCGRRRRRPPALPVDAQRVRPAPRTTRPLPRGRLATPRASPPGTGCTTSRRRRGRRTSSAPPPGGGGHAGTAP